MSGVSDIIISYDMIIKRYLSATLSQWEQKVRMTNHVNVDVAYKNVGLRNEILVSKIVDLSRLPSELRTVSRVVI